MVLEEAGRAVARSAYRSVALAVAALGILEPNPQRDRLLRDTVAGTVIPVVALAGEGIGTGSAFAWADAATVEPPFRLVPGIDGLRLHGDAEFRARRVRRRPAAVARSGSGREDRDRGAGA